MLTKLLVSSGGVANHLCVMYQRTERSGLLDPKTSYLWQFKLSEIDEGMGAGNTSVDGEASSREDAE